MEMNEKVTLTQDNGSINRHFGISEDKVSICLPMDIILNEWKKLTRYRLHEKLTLRYIKRSSSIQYDTLIARLYNKYTL